MTTSEYLDRLLLCYSGSFNIYQPYRINDREYPAYGYFFSAIEKYILVREINMWSSQSYEHILFMEVERCTEETLQEAEKIIAEYMEPVLVRKNEPLPEPNHMYSYLDVVIISASPIEKEIAKRIRRYHFEKGYRFNIRGFSKGSILCVSLEDQKYYSNYHSRNKREIFQKVFSDTENGMPGFSQVMEEKGLTPFKQEETE